MALIFFGAFVIRFIEKCLHGCLEFNLEVLIVNLGGSARLLPLLLKSVATFFNNLV